MGQPMPLSGTHIRQKADVRDTGIVDEQINVTKGAQRTVNQTVPVFLGGDIAVIGCHTDRKRQCICGMLQGVPVMTAIYDEIPAALSEKLCRGKTDTPGRAGDHCCVHDVKLLSGSIACKT